MISFGAVADGKTDDTAAIQSAAKAAGPSGSIYFPPGTYYFASSLYMNIPGQTWTLQSGATLLAGNTIYLQAASTTLAGPGAIDEQGATRLGVRIDYNGTAAAPTGNGDVVDGVEMYNMGPPWGAFVFANGDYATVENCYFHDALSDAAMIDTDGGSGHTGISFLSDRFNNIQQDAIHSKGTNANWNNGTWIPTSEQDVGFRFIGNVATKVGLSGSPGFSFEIQDGHVGTIFENNQADHTYSIVGQVNATVSNNSFVGPEYWGMEYGNARDGLVTHNSFSSCSIGIAMTGNTDQLNVGNTFSYNTFTSCPTMIQVAWDGGGNIYIGNTSY